MYKRLQASNINLKMDLKGGQKIMFDFSVIVVSVAGAGSLAFSFVEYALTRKNKHQKTENKQ